MEQAKLSSGSFANVLLDGGAAAVSDETFLEQTKLKAQEALENALLMTTRLQRLRRPAAQKAREALC